MAGVEIDISYSDRWREGSLVQTSNVTPPPLPPASQSPLAPLSGGCIIFLGGGAKGVLTIGQHPQPSGDYEEDYVIGIRRPEFRGGGAGAPL